MQLLPGHASQQGRKLIKRLAKLALTRRQASGSARSTDWRHRAAACQMHVGRAGSYGGSVLNLLETDAVCFTQKADDADEDPVRRILRAPDAFAVLGAVFFCRQMICMQSLQLQVGHR